MPERFGGGDYRYSFNGMEKDDEVKGEGNHLDFGARCYDSRLGRWFSVDPLEKKYPYMSSYVGIGNNPVMLIDKDGREIIIHYKDKEGNNKSYTYGSALKVPNNDFVIAVINSLDEIKAADPTISRSIDKIANSTTKILDVVEVDNINDFAFTGVQSSKSSGKIFKPGDKPSSLSDIEINSGTIGFNSNISIMFKVETNSEPNTISPRTAFAHELGHAFSAFFSFRQAYFRRSAHIPKYGDYEEKFATDFFENVVAGYYGEGIRKNHQGVQITTASYNSNEPTSTNENQISEGLTEVKL